MDVTTTEWVFGRLPVQGLGLMRLADEGWGQPDRDPLALVRAAVDAGVTLLDTAEMYGNEELVGRIVGPVRDRVTLCSKFGVYWGASGDRDDWSVRADPATVRTAIEGSLRRLNVDTIDLYYLHHRSNVTPIEDTVLAMAELVRAGKIRAIGLSNVTVDDVRRAHLVHPVTAVQEQWAVTQRNVEPMLPTLAELGITLVAHSPHGHGSLHSPTDSPLATTLDEIATRHRVTRGQVALAWVHGSSLGRDQPVVPLPGTTRISHLLANVAAASLVLEPFELDRLDALASL
ncbi:aldo/keto reductase [Rhodococcus sovatensis]|uniref:Aldo/keto reductase n=1 Tax=Rhodococcus sovatensis TaxID=1805840 RepID=A0ABZ2PNS1_9NOCA